MIIDHTLKQIEIFWSLGGRKDQSVRYGQGGRDGKGGQHDLEVPCIALSFIFLKWHSLSAGRYI